MESRASRVLPMSCMVCREPVGLYRRIGSFWFCSEAHYTTGKSRGYVDRVHHNRADENWEHNRNPVDPMSCYYCGKSIGLWRRARGNWYCTDACYLEHFPKSRQAGAGRRILMATSLSVVGGLALKNISSTGQAKDSIPAQIASLWKLTPWSERETPVIPISFLDEGELRLWMANRDTWRLSKGTAEPISSVLFGGIKKFVAGSLQFTTRGGVGFVMSADEKLSTYHFVNFRPEMIAGKIVDFTLERGTQINSAIVDVSKRRLKLGPKVASRLMNTFEVRKDGETFQAFMQQTPGRWTWLDTWHSEKLPDGRVGLYVGNGQRYGVVSGVIRPDDVVT